MPTQLRINRDPFDALICAAARDLDLPLMSRDGHIRGSDMVRVIWQASGPPEDREAFAALFRRRQAEIYRFALHLTGVPAVAWT
jgi:hypothetical protein